MPRKEYPYQNLSLKNIKGEKWKDVPSLEGYFVVSNFGRIKRLEYEMQYKNGAIYTKLEKIIKPAIVKQPNQYKKDYSRFLTARVTLDGIRYNFMLSRLLYHCFVQPINLTDHTMVIRTKDNNNFNIRPSNLKKATLSEKQQTIFKRKRAVSPLLQMSTEKKRQIRDLIIKNKSRPVTQFSPDGKKMRTYSSMTAAQRETGIHSSSIGQSALKHKKIITAGGYIWRFGDEQPGSIARIRQERRKESRKKYGQKVTQYDFTGKRIAYYPSIKDAGETTGIDSNLIGAAIRGVYKSAKGFYWQKGYGKNFIDLSNYKWGRESMAATQSKKVNQYTLSGKYIQTFASVAQAAKYIGVNNSALSEACRKENRTCRGFIWNFASRPRPTRSLLS